MILPSGPLLSPPTIKSKLLLLPSDTMTVPAKRDEQPVGYESQALGYDTLTCSGPEGYPTGI